MSARNMVIKTSKGFAMSIVFLYAGGACSSAGRLVFRGGQLVPISYDLYMALEYCDQVKTG
jgi:hypothetical protein